jgi:hypothetical protein
MAQEIEKLVVSMNADLRQYEREMARANKVTVTQLRGIERQAQASLGRFEKTVGSAG